MDDYPTNGVDIPTNGVDNVPYFLEQTQLDRIEAKLDEILVFKAELEAAVAAFQSAGVMGMMKGMFSSRG